ncbi:zinc-binding alcohol dehydrogenase family protein [Granulosicoccus antarcticus]|uniref:L-galactonate-5-dehydrogenase n=1 Tax=Granulosicoccus antarcticus IMCC3135 TaxID=1192854 RepID=A0A2Z2NL07_9GAMM|nr:zinc-binding alcohol dehydrogenase family protein [Granulosicoccus antarcticus]ASJ72006.1 L-galactonate-5-dehydrogenase [Granulosicoccus antarcticus IMCC3135]
MNSNNMMQAGVVVEPGTFAVQDRPVPTSTPEGWVMINICAVGLCGTDYHILDGKHPFLEYPRVIGHELSGRIASDGNGWSAGELVVVNPYLSCGTCRACQRGKPNCCYKIEVLGVHRDGGLVPQLAVPAENLYPADGLTSLQAAMVEFLAIGAHAVNRSGVCVGDNVLVTGVGPIGIGTALFARLKGATVTLLDLSPERLAMAEKRFGFTQSCVSMDAAIEATDGEGYDTVFDATGHGGAIEAGFPAVAHGGSYVLVSVVKDNISFSDPEFHKREMRLIGSRNALKADFDWVMSAFQDKLIDADALCSSILSMDELAATFNDLAAERANLIKVIVRLQE